MHKDVRKNMGQLGLALMLLGLSAGFGFGVGFEYGTGIPATMLLTELFTEKTESVGIPPDIAPKTTEEAREVVAAAVKDDNYGIGYNCLDMAWDSMRALNWDGQPGAIAGILFEDGTGHALVLTATTDDNWIFLDAETGAKVTPIPGGYFAGDKIVAVKILVLRWVDYEDFMKNPIFEVTE